MTTALPDLWTDWCSVTGHSAAEVDDSALTSFARQARPPQTVLGALRRRRNVTADPKDAPAWPPALRSDPVALHRLLSATGSMAVDPGLQWISRLRLLRLRFAAVLLAPRVQGGLGLDRSTAATLTPRGFEESRPAVGDAQALLDCPACAITAWLDVLSANSAWSRLGVRELAASSTTSTPTNHQHEPSNSAWTDWPDHPNLLPAIDRWGTSIATDPCAVRRCRCSSRASSTSRPKTPSSTSRSRRSRCASRPADSPLTKSTTSSREPTN